MKTALLAILLLLAGCTSGPVHSDCGTDRACRDASNLANKGAASLDNCMNPSGGDAAADADKCAGYKAPSYGNHAGLTIKSVVETVSATYVNLTVTFDGNAEIVNGNQFGMDYRLMYGSEFTRFDLGLGFNGTRFGAGQVASNGGIFQDYGDATARTDGSTIHIAVPRHDVNVDATSDGSQIHAWTLLKQDNGFFCMWSAKDIGVPPVNGGTAICNGAPGRS